MKVLTSTLMATSLVASGLAYSAYTSSPFGRDKILHISVRQLFVTAAEHFGEKLGSPAYQRIKYIDHIIEGMDHGCTLLSKTKSTIPGPSLTATKKEIEMRGFCEQIDRLNLFHQNQKHNLSWIF